MRTGRKYFVKADPRSNPHLASAADVIGSKFFYALGYNMPENYIAYFTKDQLRISPKAKITPPGGREREMTEFDLDPLLEQMPREDDGRYRVLASLAVEGEGIGPARWYGTRSDDPNDIFPHEHRRTARGLYPMAAWLNHTDIKAGQTYDTIVEDGGVPHIKHYLVDFGSMLGSDSDSPKDVRLGHRYMIDKSPAVLVKMVTRWILGRGLGARRLRRQTRDRAIHRRSVPPGSLDSQLPESCIPESPPRRRVLGRQAGHGVHQRGDPRDRRDRRIFRSRRSGLSGGHSCETA